ncbi:MAG TPA: branched-chain amino acid ABC transporter permease [Burkholderiales bacterium]|nr:branched-chain amino acid ABC transporter permease [Burkholderiales bacterium]
MGGSARRMQVDFHLSLGVLGLLALAPLAISNAYWLGVLIVSMYFALLAAGWNLLAGYSGQFSIAPAAFGMIGAYTTGLLSYHWKLPPLVGIPAAIIVAGGIGALLGLVVMRLRGPYLALTTLSFAEIARLVIGNSYGFTRGDLGLNVPGIFESRLAYYYLFVAVVLASQVALYLLLRSRAGLFLQAVRDDEVAAASRGVHVVTWKIAAFTLSTALSGLAGALYAHFSRFVSPELGLVAQTGLVISMVVIGGIGSLVGPIFGAVLVYASSELLRGVGGIQLIVFSLLVILIARFFREGLWGLAKRALGLS